MGLFGRKKREREQLYYLSSPYVVDACARMGGEPFFVKQIESGETVALYIIGEDEVWANYNAVLARKYQIEHGEDVVAPTPDVLARVAFAAVYQSYMDKETGKSVMVYAVDDKFVKFTAEEIVEERKRQLETKKTEKTVKYDELEDIARVNDCICVVGHLGCDEAVGTWVRTDGKLVRKTLGAVRAKRIELGLEDTSQEEDSL